MKTGLKIFRMLKRKLNTGDMITIRKDLIDLFGK
jgi:hypothetical protein